MSERIEVKWTAYGGIDASRPADLHAVAHVDGIEIAVWGWSATPLDVHARAAILLPLGHTTRRIIDSGGGPVDTSRLTTMLLAWLNERPELTHALVRVR